jgi:hypothetical protein
LTTSKSKCLHPKTIGDPSIPRIAASNFDYHTKTKIPVENKEVDMDVEGVAYYPSDLTSIPDPFTKSIDKAPIVFVVNGKALATHFNPSDRCDKIPPVKGGTLCEVWAPPNKQLSPPPGWKAIESFKGFEYFQEKLAKQGIISVSVNLNRIDDASVHYGINLIEDKAKLIIAAIEYFQQLNKKPQHVLNNHINFEATGLVGHSQGGEVVIVAAQNFAAQKVKGLSGVNIKGVLAIAPTDMFWNGNFSNYIGSKDENKMGENVKISQFAFMVILPAADGDVYHCPGAKYYDMAVPNPFKIQLYVHGANHNYFNSNWTIDDSLGVIAGFPNGAVPYKWDLSTGKVKIQFYPNIKLPLSLDLNRDNHQQILSVYGCAFFRRMLLDETTMDNILFHVRRPDGVKFDNIHLSFQHMDAVTVDNHEEENGISFNSLTQPTSQSNGLKAMEFLLTQLVPNKDQLKYPIVRSKENYTFFGYSTGMITDYNRRNGIFISNLPPNGKGYRNLSDKDVCIRVAEVAIGDPPDDKKLGFNYANRSGFELGLQDDKGVTSWIHSDAVGGLSRPYYRGQVINGEDPFMTTKTMLETMLFPSECFKRLKPNLDTSNIISICIRTNLLDTRPLAFDDLQIL